jgi:hypothetical protein
MQQRLLTPGTPGSQSSPPSTWPLPQARVVVVVLGEVAVVVLELVGALPVVVVVELVVEVLVVGEVVVEELVVAVVEVVEEEEEEEVVVEVEVEVVVVAVELVVDEVVELVVVDGVVVVVEGGITLNWNRPLLLCQPSTTMKYVSPPTTLGVMTMRCRRTGRCILPDGRAEVSAQVPRRMYSTVSKSLPQVSIWAVPLRGGTHRNTRSGERSPCGGDTGGHGASR